MSEPTAAILTSAIERSVVSVYRELTLDQAHFLTGISPTILRRRWKFDEDWKSVIYLAGSHQRTTLYLIAEAQQKSATTARARAKEKSIV
jgi:hypothetical protein